MTVPQNHLQITHSLRRIRREAAVSQQLHRSMPGRTIWQKSFYDHIIRSETGYQAAWRYIDENPVRWYINRGLPVPISPDDI